VSKAGSCLLQPISHVHTLSAGHALCVTCMSSSKHEDFKTIKQAPMHCSKPMNCRLCARGRDVSPSIIHMLAYTRCSHNKDINSRVLLFKSAHKWMRSAESSGSRCLVKIWPAGHIYLHAYIHLFMCLCVNIRTTDKEITRTVVRSVGHIPQLCVLCGSAWPAPCPLHVRGESLYMHVHAIEAHIHKSNYVHTSTYHACMCVERAGLPKVLVGVMALIRVMRSSGVKRGIHVSLACVCTCSRSARRIIYIYICMYM
jgi:hypothetical protein